MPNSTIFRIQDLPVELERSIFELAARIHLRYAPRLALVSRTVREWTQPVIYEMVTLGSGDVRLFLRTVDMFPPSFFAQYVKILCLTVSVRAQDATKILQCCTGVTDLACWVDFRDSNIDAPVLSLSQLLTPLPLRRLSIEIRHFQELSLVNCAWAATLSHLDLRLWVRPESFRIPWLQNIPLLTHLGVYSGHWGGIFDDDSLGRILFDKPSLRVLCLVTDEVDRENDRPPLGDPRIVYMARLEPVPDWEAPYRGLQDTWSRAEEVVARRLAAMNSSSV